MMTRAFTIFILILGLIVPNFADAQAGRKQRLAADEESLEMEDEAPEKVERKKPSRTKSSRRSRDKREKDDEEEEEAPTMSSKEEIEAHLASRVKELKKFHQGQILFGRRMNSSWTNFWAKTYEDRKLFDVRMARQRLNLFESLSSLDSSFHSTTIGDFDRLQATQIKSFEANLQKNMADYLEQMMKDLKEFTVEQEKLREDFSSDLKNSWTSQKTHKKESAKERRRDRKSEEKRRKKRRR